jgi:glycosyltransferase involved in cell wall biosynthesis
MKIGLDARFLTHPQRGGFKTYTVNLINAIHRLDDENQYFIYLDRPVDMDTLPVKQNFNYRIVSGTLPVIGMPFREQVLLRRQIAKDRLDILHSLCNTAPVERGIKRITTLHDTIQVTTKIRFMDPPGFKYWMIMAYSKWAIKRAIRNPDWVITVSEFEKSQILKLFHLPEDHIVVTHLAANSTFNPVGPDERSTLCLEIKKKFGLLENFILGVGFEDRKNIPLLIDAFQHLAQDFPQTNLVIVSAEENKQRYFRQLVKDHHLDERVTILGSVAATDLIGLYNLAKVFVFPSERESFGLPPLEAIACGTPTVAMNSSSLPEILGNGALFVDGKDPQKWADAIRAILTDENLRSQMIERGLERASELSWDNCARNTIQAYTQVVRGT